MTDILKIAYDENGKDLPCLVVARNKGDTMEIVNGIVGEKATELYNLLIRGNRNDTASYKAKNHRASREYIKRDT